MIKKIMIALGVSLAMMGSANAALKSYDISWVGSNNYSMTGNFSFDAATAGPVVDETELSSFFIQGFHNGNSVGSHSSAVENFNFDATTGNFLVGGSSTSDTGQRWNSGGTGFGFSSRRYSQGFTFDGSFYSVTSINIGYVDSTLEASSLSTVPLPAALPLYAAGMAVLGFFGYRRKRSNLATA